MVERRETLVQDENKPHLFLKFENYSPSFCFQILQKYKSIKLLQSFFPILGKVYWDLKYIGIKHFGKLIKCNSKPNINNSNANKRENLRKNRLNLLVPYKQVVYIY